MAAPLMTVWSGDMADVAEICGDEVARELCEKLPGIWLYIPKKWTANTALHHIDRQMAERLMAAFGGGKIETPGKRRSADDTFRAVEELVDRGLTTQQIALQLDITQAYVFQLRRRAGAPKIASKPDPRQRPLFE